MGRGVIAEEAVPVLCVDEAVAAESLGGPERAGIGSGYSVLSLLRSATTGSRASGPRSMMLPPPNLATVTFGNSAAPSPYERPIRACRSVVTRRVTATSKPALRNDAASVGWLGGAAEPGEVFRDRKDTEQVAGSVDRGHAARVRSRRQLIPDVRSRIRRHSRTVVRELGGRRLSVVHAFEIRPGERPRIAAVLGQERHAPVRAGGKPLPHLSDRRIRWERIEPLMKNLCDRQVP